MMNYMSKAAKVVGCWFLILTLVLSLPVAQLSAATTWLQTDWSGGSGQSNWIDEDKFTTATNTDVSVAGEVKLDLGSPSDWYDGSWLYRKQITINADQVAGSDPLSNYPLLLNFSSDSELAANAQDDGDDLVFTSADGTTVLSYEIESFDGSTGELQAWVSIPSLSATVDTTLYLYYGNSDSGLTDGSTPEQIWSEYGLVYHLMEQSGQHLDATSNNNDTTTATLASQGTAEGQINGADLMDSFSQVVTPDNANGSLDLTTDFTISSWIYTLGIGTEFQLLLTKSVDGGNPTNYAIYINFSNIYIAWYNNGDQSFSTSTNPISANTWHLLTYRRSGQTESIYVDGVEQATRTNVNPDLDMVANNENLLIGKQPFGLYFNGRIDEFRISQNPFSVDYLSTEYANQSSPATFYAVAAEEEFAEVFPSSGSLTSSIFDSGQASEWGTLSFQATTPAGTTAQVKVRSGNASDLSDATDFSSCTALDSGESLTSSCATNATRYLQYQLVLASSDENATPTVSEVSLEYSPVVEVTTSTASSESSPASETPKPPSCDAWVPVGIPDLFQINRSPTEVTLYFSPVKDNVQGYHVMYGFSEYEQRFGALSLSSTEVSQGVQSVTINNLDPAAKYWFSVAPVNGCAVGDWSNWQSVPRQFEGLKKLFRYFL